MTVSKLTDGKIVVGSVRFPNKAGISGFLTGTVSVDPASIAAGAKGTTTVTVTGVLAGDIVVMEPPAALEAALIFCGARAGADSISIDLYNASAVAVDGTARTWGYRVIDIVS